MWPQMHSQLLPGIRYHRSILYRSCRPFKHRSDQKRRRLNRLRKLGECSKGCCTLCSQKLHLLSICLAVLHCQHTAFSNAQSACKRDLTHSTPLSTLEYLALPKIQCPTLCKPHRVAAQAHYPGSYAAIRRRTFGKTAGTLTSIPSQRLSLLPGPAHMLGVSSIPLLTWNAQKSIQCNHSGSPRPLAHALALLPWTLGSTRLLPRDLTSARQGFAGHYPTDRI